MDWINYLYTSIFGSATITESSANQEAPEEPINENPADNPAGNLEAPEEVPIVDNPITNQEPQTPANSPNIYISQTPNLDTPDNNNFPMNEPPANWINIRLWHPYYSLTRKFPREFSRIKEYISKFRQADIEMIVPHLFDEKFDVYCNCVKPCDCGPIPQAYGLGNADLFRTILKKRESIKNLSHLDDNVYLELEFVRPVGSTRAGFEYKFKTNELCSDTKYVYRYPY